jgi:hypothetical protein
MLALISRHRPRLKARPSDQAKRKRLLSQFDRPVGHDNNQRSPTHHRQDGKVVALLITPAASWLGEKDVAIRFEDVAIPRDENNDLSVMAKVSNDQIAARSITRRSTSSS